MCDPWWWSKGTRACQNSNKEDAINASLCIRLITDPEKSTDCGCPCMWSRTLSSEVALAHIGLLCQRAMKYVITMKSCTVPEGLATRTLTFKQHPFYLALITAAATGCMADASPCNMSCILQKEGAVCSPRTPHTRQQIWFQISRHTKTMWIMVSNSQHIYK